MRQMQVASRAAPKPKTMGWQTLADLLHALGDIAPARVLAVPTPGTATEKDLVRLQTHDNRHCELVDGVLIEKTMGFAESHLAFELGFALRSYLQDHDLGFVAGADGPTQLWKGLVRMPDLSFVAWSKMPSHHVPTTPIAEVVPTIAVEVLSAGNTRAEMDRKRREYFQAGVELVWMVDPPARTVDVYTTADEFTTLTESETLHGGNVLPGFALPLRQLFARLPRKPRGAGKKKGKSK